MQSGILETAHMLYDVNDVPGTYVPGIRLLSPCKSIAAFPGYRVHNVLVCKIPLRDVVDLKSGDVANRATLAFLWASLPGTRYDTRFPFGMWVT